TCGLCDNQVRTRSSRCSLNPLVPTTTLIPWSMHQCRLSITASGVVKSTTTSAPASEALNRPSPWPIIATSSRSSAASTALHTSPPIRPCAPSTPTRTASVTGPNLPSDAQRRGQVLVQRATDQPVRLGEDVRQQLPVPVVDRRVHDHASLRRGRHGE